MPPRTRRKSKLNSTHTKTVSDMATKSSIPALPIEVLLCIVCFLDNIDLKNVRLANKTLASLVEARLFSRMVLVPYRDCLDGFADIMRNESIAQNVRSLHYDCRWRYKPGLVLTSTPEDEDDGLSLKEAGLMSKSDETLETILLSRSLALLPSLENVLISEYDGEEYPYYSTPLTQSVSYFQRVGRNNGMNFIVYSRMMDEWLVEPTASGGKATLLAIWASNAKIKSFSGTSLDADILLSARMGADGPKEMQSYQSVMKHLTQLKLAFAWLDNGDGGRASFTHMPSLAQLIMAAPDVERLQLYMTDNGIDEGYYFNANDSWLSPLTRDANDRLCNRAIFTRLKHLSLGDILCQEEELLALVRTHRNTLLELSLDTMMLIRTKDQVGPPCWIRLFKKIRALHLPTVRVLGQFNNMARQNFTVNPTSLEEPDSLYCRMLRWLSDEGHDPCPVEKARVRVDEIGIEMYPSKEKFFRGDKSWTFHWRSGDGDDDSTDADESSGYPCIGATSSMNILKTTISSFED